MIFASFAVKDFGIRISDFFRPSTFDLRTSLRAHILTPRRPHSAGSRTRTLALLDINEGPQRNRQTEKPQADDERLSLDQPEIHQKEAAQAAAGQSANQHPPARTQRRQHDERQRGSDVDPDVDPDMSGGAMGEGVGEQGAQDVEDAQEFQQLAGAAQVQAGGALRREHETEEERAVEREGERLSRWSSK